MHKYLNLNCFFTFYVLTWEAVQVLVLNFDSAARISFFLGVLIFFKIILKRKKILKKPVRYYFLWLIYAFINSSIQGIEHFDNSHYRLFVNLFLPFILFWMVMNYREKDRIIIHNTIIFSLTVYLLLVVVLGNFQTDRLGSELNANSTGLRASFLLFFILLKLAYEDIKIKSALLLMVFPIVIIILSGSRTSYGVMIILMLSLLYIINNNLSKSVKFVVITCAVSGLILVNNFVLTSTSLGERLAQTTTQSSTSDVLITGTNWDYLGDRGLQYVLAGPIIQENPVFGIGLRNFLDYSVTNTVLHSEYLIHLCECGIIGFILFLLFYYWIGRNLVKKLKMDPTSKSITIVYLAGFLSLLFLSWFTRVCYYPFYYGFLGMAVAHIYSSPKTKHL